MRRCVIVHATKYRYDVITHYTRRGFSAKTTSKKEKKQNVDLAADSDKRHINILNAVALQYKLSYEMH